PNEQPVPGTASRHHPALLICDRPGDLGVNEIAMATLATAIDKSAAKRSAISSRFLAARVGISHDVRTAAWLWTDFMHSSSQRQRAKKDTLAHFDGFGAGCWLPARFGRVEVLGSNESSSGAPHDKDFRPLRARRRILRAP